MARDPRLELQLAKGRPVWRDVQVSRTTKLDQTWSVFLKVVRASLQGNEVYASLADVRRQWEHHNLPPVGIRHVLRLTPPELAPIEVVFHVVKDYRTNEAGWEATEFPTPDLGWCKYRVLRNYGDPESRRYFYCHGWEEALAAAEEALVEMRRTSYPLHDDAPLLSPNDPLLSPVLFKEEVS